MRHLAIDVGPLRFVARLEQAAAPRTCAAFLRLLPFERQLIHVRWSGEAVWVPQPGLEAGIGYENATCHPARGDLLFHPGGIAEPEILFAYGACSFASRSGALAGNHFMTIVEGREQLPELGRLVLWHGARTLRCHEPGAA